LKLSEASKELKVKNLARIDNLTYTYNIAKTLMMDLLDLAQVENNTFRINQTKFSLLSVIGDAFKVV
jgi:hypothetical protein